MLFGPGAHVAPAPRATAGAASNAFCGAVDEEQATSRTVRAINPVRREGREALRSRMGPFLCLPRPWQLRIDQFFAQGCREDILHHAAYSQQL